MATSAHDITGTRLAVSLVCSVCGKSCEGGTTDAKVYQLVGARSLTGQRIVAVHARCIAPNQLEAAIAEQKAHEEAYFAARCRAEDKRQGLAY